MTLPTPTPTTRGRVRTAVGDKSRTKQAPKAETDINVIMERYRTTGQLDIPSAARGVYGDFTNVGDYFSALNKVMAAQDSFDRLPSGVRDQLANEPANLVKLSENPDLDPGLAAELGMIEPPPDQVIEETPAGGQTVIPGSETPSSKASSAPAEEPSKG